MTDVLYHWPDVAKFGQPVPKTKFYAHGSVSAAVRELFVTEVEGIVWAYKLAESTINLPPSSDVPEIQVLVVRGKGDDVDESVLATIDKAIKQPVIFEIVTSLGTRMTATLKTGASVQRYYSTEWIQADTRLPLPASISLPNLYLRLLEPLLPTSIRAGEGLSDVADRLIAMARLQRDIATLERKLRAEPQLNRKVELRRTLMTQCARLAELTNPTPVSTTATTN